MAVKTRKTAVRPIAAPAVRPDTSRQSLWFWVGFGGLLIATLATYSPALQSAYIWDDDMHVIDNHSLRSLEGLGKIWTDPAATPQYYPLVHTMFWAEYHLWGLQPAGYHIINVLLHSLIAVLIWRVLLRLKVPGAFLAAAIFALHPVHVESVAWITERKNVLSGLFYVLALAAYLRFDPLETSAEPAKRRWLWYAVSLLLFVCALLSKSVTCSLPVILLLLTWWKRGRVSWKNVAAVVPMLVLGALSGLATAYLESHRVGASGQEWSLDPVERALVAGRALWFYAGKLFWPHPIIFVYPRWVIRSEVWWQYLFPVAALAVIAAMWLGRRRLGRGPLAAVLFFTITLTPALGFFNVYWMRYSWVADHFQYLASLGLIVLLSALVTQGAARLSRGFSRMGTAAAFVLPAVLALCAWQETHKYESQEILWRDTLAKNPSSWMAHDNMGWSLAETNRGDEAIGHFAKALELKRDDWLALADCGIVLHRQGRESEAILRWREALRYRPDYALVHAMLGDSLVEQGNLREGMQHLREAVRLAPNDVTPLNGLGVGLMEQGNIAGAIAALSKAVQREPDMPEYRVNLAAAWLLKGNTQRADEQMAAATRLRPDPVNYIQLGSLLARLTRPDEAIRQFRQALQVKSDYLPAMTNLAWLLATCDQAELRNGPEALLLAQQVCEKTSYQSYPALDTLAAAYAESGQFEQAAKAAQAAIQCAAASGKEEATGPIRERLELYLQRQPYHQATESPGEK